MQKAFGLRNVIVVCTSRFWKSELPFQKVPGQVANATLQINAFGIKSTIDVMLSSKCTHNVCLHYFLSLLCKEFPQSNSCLITWTTDSYAGLVLAFNLTLFRDISWGISFPTLKQSMGALICVNTSESFGYHWHLVLTIRLVKVSPLIKVPLPHWYCPPDGVNDFSFDSLRGSYQSIFCSWTLMFSVYQLHLAWVESVYGLIQYLCLPKLMLLTCMITMD